MQYILTPFKPEAQNEWEYAYEIVSAFTASFQVKVTTTTNQTQTNFVQVRVSVCVFMFELTFSDFIRPFT